MMIDQEWAIENIDIIMKYFTLLNKSENSSNRSRDKKKMEIDCDTVRYRAYYYLARDEEKRNSFPEENYGIHSVQHGSRTLINRT